MIIYFTIVLVKMIRRPFRTNWKFRDSSRPSFTRFMKVLLFSLVLVDFAWEFLSTWAIYLINSFGVVYAIPILFFWYKDDPKTKKVLVVILTAIFLFWVSLYIYTKGEIVCFLVEYLGLNKEERVYQFWFFGTWKESRRIPSADICPFVTQKPGDRSPAPLCPIIMITELDYFYSIQHQIFLWELSTYNIIIDDGIRLSDIYE